DQEDRHHQARRYEPNHRHWTRTGWRRRGAPSGSRGWVVLSMLRWVPCLGFPSPVSLAGIWSAYRTPRSRLQSVGQRAHHPQPFGSRAMLRRRFSPLLRLDDLDVKLLELRGLDLTRRAEHQVLVALCLREGDDITPVVVVRVHRHQTVEHPRARL